MKENVLDNPVWEALITEQADLAQGTAHAKRYRKEVLSFIGCKNTASNDITDLQSWISEGESFFIVGDLPPLPAGWTVELELPCAQMLLPAGLTPPATVKEPAEIFLLGDADASDMYDLVNRVQPGYFNPETRRLGTYYGIRQEGKLVAMAGERIRIKGFSELSAIVTDPAFTGRGYAQQLITQLCTHHAANGITSFLHVSLANERAIRLYEHMGFVTRRSIVFRRVKKGA